MTANDNTNTEKKNSRHRVHYSNVKRFSTAINKKYVKIFLFENFSIKALAPCLKCITHIEIVDIECVLLSFFSENFVSTKWRIYKGIFGSSRLLRKGISRGREECDCFFFVKQSLQKDINSRF